MATKDYFDFFLNDICEHKGQALSIKFFLKNYHQYVVDNKREIYHGSIVAFFDQTESHSNLSSPPPTYQLDNTNIEKSTKEFVRLNDSLFFTKFYESFTKYLKDIVAFQLFNNKGYKESIEIKESDFEGIRKRIKSIRKLDTDFNKHLFTILVETSPTFKKFNNDNDWVGDFFQLYKVFAVIRNIIAHQDSILNQTDESRIINFGSLFDKYFEVEIQQHNKKVFIKGSKMDAICRTFCELAFVMYKAISIDNEEEWNHYELSVK